MLSVFALGVVARLLYLFELRGHELLAYPLGDDALFDAWARRIAGGDWLGEGAFYQAPLYAYLLGALYACGGDVLAARVVQALLGGATAALLCHATTDLLAHRGAVARRAGWVAGLAYALYAPAIHYDALLEKTALATLLLAVVLALVAAPRPASGCPPRRALALGIAVGALAVTRENVALVALPLLAWLAVGRGRTKRVLAFVAGAALLLSPFAARNAAVGEGFGLGASNFGPNLYIGNHAGADGLYAPLVPGQGTHRFERDDASELARRETGRELDAGEVSRFWAGRAIAWMRAEPARALELTLRKAWLLASDREWMDSRSYVVHRSESSVLTVLGTLLRFGVLLPLALAGLAWAWPDRRRLALPIALLLTIAASIVPFFVFGRFRMSLVVALVPFGALGALGATELPRRLRRREKGTIRALLLALAGAALAWIHPPPVWPPYEDDLEYPVADTYNNLGSAQLAAGDTIAAERSFERAIEARPWYGAPKYNLCLSRVARDELEAAARLLQPPAEPTEYLVEGNLALAEGYMRRGDTEAASRHLALARERGAEQPEDFMRIGLLARHLGDDRVAEDHYRAALVLRPDYAEVHNNLGYLLQSTDRPAEAAKHYTRAIRIDPDYVRALVNLAWLRLESTDPSVHDPTAALELAGRVALLLGPDDPDANRLVEAARAAQ